jgi:hypothetical protein
MLDECKGDRLEEVLAIFSTAVLKKAVRENGGRNPRAIAEQLAMENFSYTGERTPLTTLIAAHKSSLMKTLSEKNGAKARYNDFADLLNLKERQTTRRSEQLKVSAEEGWTNAISDDDAQALRDTVDKNWSGSIEWLEAILHGGYSSQKDGLLARSFDDVWRHVENGSIGDVEYSEREGLLEQLDARVRQQSHRLEKWQDFEKRLSNGHAKSLKDQSSDARKKTAAINLDFGVHERLQLNYGLTKPTGYKSRPPLDEYAQLIANMQSELSNVGKRGNTGTSYGRRESPPRTGSKSTTVSIAGTPEAASPLHESLVSASNTDTEELSPRFEKHVPKSTSHTPPSEHAVDDEEAMSSAESSSPAAEQEPDHLTVQTPSASRSISTVSAMPPPSPPSRPSSPLASEILASVLKTSPSPTKPRHVLSLAERTRLSMARVSMAKSDFHLEDLDDDVPELDAISHAPKSRKGLRISTHDPKPSVNPNTQHEDLIARTRQSMSNFSSIQKSAHVERRRSIKADARKKRESYRPKPLEAAIEDEDLALDGLDKKKLIEGEVEVDYDVVFKSRPRIKTSPERSPERSPVKAWGDMGGMAESSSPLSDRY